MREICIKTVYREGSEHVIRLGNGTAHRFKSEKAARKFLADTNRFLSGILFKANQFLSELYTHGREIWINTDEIRESDQLNDQYRLLEDFLKQSYLRAPWQAGNYLAFIDLKKFCEASKSLIKFLKNVRHVRQTDTLRRHRLDYLFDIVHGIEMSILNYGQLEAYEHFNTSKIFDSSNFVSQTSNLRIA